MTKSIFDDLNKLSTESRNSLSFSIDKADSLTIAQIINQEDKNCSIAVSKVLPEISIAIDLISFALMNNGRLIYIGAGTSGRLGVLDASECPPTFGTDPNMIIGIIAGGDIALRKAQEGSEDKTDTVISDLKNIKINKNDIVCGIMASGRTPYVISGINYARSLKCRTIIISCNNSKYLKTNADVNICVDAGPEVITGSTRMKAGTMQKMILNMLSTGAMIRIGKVYQNIMIDLQMNSEKLVERAKKIIIEICNISYIEAEKILIKSDYNVKTAILMSLTSKSKKEANDLLKKNKGRLTDAIS